MKRTQKIVTLVVLLVVTGCATLPDGPSVRVLPTPGKSFEKFLAEDSECRYWANRMIGQSPQEAADRTTASGAVLGTVLGAGIGAALGAASGDAGAGAAIGAGTGLLFGTASGASSGQVYGYEAQRRYDNTYVQCMYSKGNQVPGTMRRVRGRSAAPPPPADMYPVPPDYYPTR